MAGHGIDLEKFRLRRFVERLIASGDVEVHEEPVPLIALSAIIEATPKATLFRKAGPEGFELVAAVAGSRRRMAAAFDSDERGVVHEYMRRMANPQPAVEIPSADAPVHQVVVTGDDIDLTRLPFFLQHELDGGCYISSGIDYSVDPATGKTNVGCRRMMLRDRKTFRSNLTAPSDLKKMYAACLARGEKLPLSFAVGSHPLDFAAACLRVPAQDEFGFVATLRGEPVPMVRGITNGVPAPADAEMIIEGYFDEQGYREYDGPYGEFWGYYGPAHIDPVFHVTAITHRRDVLHQSVLHGTSNLARTDGATLNNLSFETHMWRALRAVNIEPVALYNCSSGPPRSLVRVSLKRGVQGQARAAINALFAVPGVQQVTVVDEDIDVFSGEEVEWAMAARFHPEHDLVVAHGLPAVYGDPALPQAKTTSKIGFDATASYGIPDSIEYWRPRPPDPARFAPRRCASVREALAAGPLHFMKIMEALGSNDGREIAMEIEVLRLEGALERLKNGAWALKGQGDHHV